MSEDEASQFNRKTWRPSRKRASQPRVRDWGGQTKAPIGLLAAARASGFASGNIPRCAHCNRFAYRGTNLCRWHNAPRVLVASGARPIVLRKSVRARYGATSEPV